MKERLINSIVCMLQGRGIDTEGIPDALYLLFKDVEIARAETALAIPDASVNTDLLKRFLAAKMVKGCTQRTIQAYRDTLHRSLERLNKPAPSITADDIRLYTAIRLSQDGISKSFMNTELRYLRSFFSWMTNDEIIAKNPMVKIECIKQPKISKKAFSDIECEKLRAACRTARETAIIEILFSTGCRVSELVGMQIDEIKSDQIVVHGKGQKDRLVYLNAKAQLAIVAYLGERKDKNPYLFPKGLALVDLKKHQHTYKGNPWWYTHPDMISEGFMAPSCIEDIVRNIGKRAGVEKTHPHRFRRTCATQALRRGMTIEMVSKMLGHEQLTTTQLYLDLTEDDLEAAHRKFVV
jgi:site-specific recombinase XerD